MRKLYRKSPIETGAVWVTLSSGDRQGQDDANKEYMPVTIKFGVLFSAVLLTGCVTQAPVQDAKATSAPTTTPAQQSPSGDHAPDMLAELIRGCLGSGLGPSGRVEACNTLLSDDTLSKEGRAAALAFRASANLDLFDYSSAIRDFTDALDINPNNIGYLDGRARALSQRGEYDLAVQDYDLAIQIAPQVAMLYAGRAANHAQMDNIDAAFRDLKQAQRLDPNDLDTLVTLGNLHIEMQDFEAATVAYDRAIEISPQRQRLFVRRGLSLLFDEQPEKALEDFNTAIELGRNSPDAFMFRALAHQQLSDDEAALKDYSETIALDPARATAWHRRGMIRMEQGEYAASLEDLDIAVQIDPSSDHLNSIAWLLVAAEDRSFRDPHAALGYVERSLALDENADNADTAAAVHALLGNQDEAMAYYDLSMKLGGEKRVKLYEDYLRERGYFSASPDGIADDQTRTAIAAFAAEKLVLLVD